MISHQSICIVKIIFVCALNTKFNVRSRNAKASCEMKGDRIKIDFICGKIMSLDCTSANEFFSA